MTSFTYPLPRSAINVRRLLEHNFPSDEPTLELLSQCDSTRATLTEYLQQNDSVFLGEYVGRSADLDTIKLSLDHHLHVAQLCNEYLKNWMQLMDLLRQESPQQLTVSVVNPEDLLFQWSGSASLADCSIQNPLVFHDTSMCFETIMCLVCASLAHLNSVQSMREYTVAASKHMEQIADDAVRERLQQQQSTIDPTKITRDFMQVTKHALMYAMMAQEQLRLFTMAPADGPSELRPRVLEGLVQYATACVQQMGLPIFVQQYEAEREQHPNEPGKSASRNLCALYMGLAFNNTIASVACNIHESDAPKTHLALTATLARSYNLISAALLRSEALVVEANMRVDNKEYSRADKCILGARLLALFAEKHTKYAEKCLTSAADKCMILISRKQQVPPERVVQQVQKRWRDACICKYEQWRSMTKSRITNALVDTKALVMERLQISDKPTDDQLLAQGLHNISYWLPQKSILMDKRGICERLTLFKKHFNYTSIYSDRTFGSTNDAEKSTVSSVAVQHLTDSTVWNLPSFSANTEEKDESVSTPQFVQTSISLSSSSSPTISSHNAETITYNQLPSVPSRAVTERQTFANDDSQSSTNNTVVRSAVLLPS
jgi:hypothetical protein